MSNILKYQLKTAFTLIAVFCMFLSVNAQSKKQIKLKKTDELTPVQVNGETAQRLKGNVVFEHEGAIMTCDSAYLFPKTNALEAYGRVKINQGDTLHMSGDSLFYLGNTKMAKLRNNIILSNPDITLTTNYLDYDLSKKVAYYYGGANINSKSRGNKLYSKTGSFNSESKQMFFKKDVKLVNEKYTMTSDTLIYNTISEITYFHGPSLIVSDSNTIYCENGWYNTKDERSSFSKNAKVSFSKQFLTGDSIYYDRNIGIGLAFENITIEDTTNNSFIKGNYALYNEKTEYALITKEPYLVQYDDQDSLFLSADTLEIITDSIRNAYYAYHNVKFYRDDIQGKADSLVYSDQDSLMHLYNNPVLWSDDNQLIADSIYIKTSKDGIHNLFMKQNAFIIAQQDSTHFNQIKGKTMTGYFNDKNELSFVDVVGNGQSIYFMEEDSTISGMNKIICSNIQIRLDSSKVKSIKFITKPSGAVLPIKDVKLEDKTLKGFNPQFAIRPKSKWDVIKH